MSYIRSALRISLCLLLMLLFAAFVLPWFVPLVRLNGFRDSIDVMAARSRRERYLLGLKIVDRVSETRLSQLYRDLIGVPPPPRWRTVRTHSPGLAIMGNYAHHGSLHAASSFAECVDIGAFSEDAKRAAVRRFLELLQSEDTDYEATEYMMALWEQVAAHDRSGAEQLINVEDLPTAQEPAGGG